MSLVGSWNVTVQTPIGEQVISLEFSDEQTGVARYGPESISLGDVSATGDHATWSVALVQPVKVNLTCSVDITGDTMSGTASAGFFGKFGLSGSRTSA
jgi:hypothetical protein